MCMYALHIYTIYTYCQKTKINDFSIRDISFVILICSLFSVRNKCALFILRNKFEAVKAGADEALVVDVCQELGTTSKGCCNF